MKKGQEELVIFLGVVLLIIVNVVIVGSVLARGEECRDVRVEEEVFEYGYAPLSGEIVVKDVRTDVNFKGEATAISRVGLKNTDVEAGWYTVMFNWETSEREIKTEDSFYVNPGEVKLYDSSLKLVLGEDWGVSHSIDPSLVIKPVLVTKVKYVERCK